MKLTTARGGTIASDYLDVKSIQVASGLNLKELSRKSGVSYGTIIAISQGKNVRKRFLDAVLKALDVDENGMSLKTSGPEPKPIPNMERYTRPYAEPAPVLVSKEEMDIIDGPQLPDVTTEDVLMGAFKQFLETLRVTIKDEIKDSLVEFLKQPEQRMTFPVTPLVVPEYVPSLPESEIIKVPAALALGLPVSMARMGDWGIEYTRRFLKELDKVGGIKALAINQIRKFAEMGELHSNIGFKKLSQGKLTEQGMDYEFRINRRWRILLHKSNQEKRYTLMRVVHHDYIEGR